MFSFQFELLFCIQIYSRRLTLEIILRVKYFHGERGRLAHLHLLMKFLMFFFQKCFPMYFLAITIANYICKYLPGLPQGLWVSITWRNWKKAIVNEHYFSKSRNACELRNKFICDSWFKLNRQIWSYVAMLHMGTPMCNIGCTYKYSANLSSRFNKLVVNDK